MDDILHVNNYLDEIGWIPPLQHFKDFGYHFMAFKCKIKIKYYKINEVGLTVRVTSLKNL
jgi:hypothetical protein